MFKYKTFRRLSPLTQATCKRFAKASANEVSFADTHLVHLYDALDNIGDTLTEIEDHDETCYPIYKIYLAEFNSLDKTFRKCLNQTIKLIKVQQKRR